MSTETQAQVCEVNGARRFTAWILDDLRTCPVCGTPLEDNCYCPNDTCTFYVSEDVQRTVGALIESGQKVEDACAIAATYTLDPEAREAVESRFTVHDRNTANWVVGKIARAQAAILEIGAMRDAEIARISARCDKLSEEHGRTISFFETAYQGQLEEWAAKELAGGKKKSVGLINGTVGFRHSKGRATITDEAAALDYCHDYDLKQCIKETPIASKLREVYEALGDPEQPGFGDENVQEAAVIGKFLQIEGEGDQFYIKAELPGLEVQ